jgi:murein DD-endopeptidase MepM/ murein hydrolase activator NlpD
MGLSLARSINRVVGTVLPERRIFLRTESRTRYVFLGPVTQLGMLAVVVGLAAGGAHVTAAYVGAQVETLSTDQRIAALTRAYDARLAAAETERAALAEALALSEERSTAAAERLAETQARHVSATTLLREANGELTSLRAQVETGAATRRSLAARLAETEATLRSVEAERRDLAARSADRTEAVAMFGTVIEKVITERDGALAENQRMSRDLHALSSEVDWWEERQEEVFTRLEEAARTGLSGLTTVFERADLDIESILEQTRADYTGSGGPFEPLADTAGADEPADERVAALLGSLEKANLLRIAVDRLPFGRPVATARQTSGFGKRRDPFRRVWSMHSGTDFAAPSGTPIFATAGGVVTFSGRQSGYGNIVIIRHAFGYETRYAHLQRTLVPVGQRVARGDMIAEMGSTGRSTGTHLHYEVRIDEQPVNPVKFIEAARDVL